MQYTAVEGDNMGDSIQLWRGIYGRQYTAVEGDMYETVYSSGRRYV